MKCVVIQTKNTGHHFVCPVPDEFDTGQYKETHSLKLKLQPVIGFHPTQMEIVETLEGTLELISAQVSGTYPHASWTSTKKKGT